MLDSNWPPSSGDEEEESREPARQRKERGSGSGKGRYATEEAREKNRQAQQRFRDKQKAEHQRQMAECADMEAEAMRLQVENLRLSQEAVMKQKVLVVREAFLAALEGGTQPPAAAAAAPPALQQHHHHQQQQQHLLQVPVQPPPVQLLQSQPAARGAQGGMLGPAAELLGRPPLSQFPPLCPAPFGSQRQQPLQQQGLQALPLSMGSINWPSGNLWMPQQPAAFAPNPSQAPLSPLELMLQQALAAAPGLTQQSLQQQQWQGAGAAQQQWLQQQQQLQQWQGGAQQQWQRPAQQQWQGPAQQQWQQQQQLQGQGQQQWQQQQPQQWRQSQQPQQWRQQQQPPQEQAQQAKVPQPASLQPAVGGAPSLPGAAAATSVPWPAAPKADWAAQQSTGASSKGSEEAAAAAALEAVVADGEAQGGASDAAGSAADTRAAPPPAAGPKADEVLQEVQGIKLPEFDDPERRRMVEEMDTPEDFMEAWRVWQVEVSHSLRDLDAGGPDSEKDLRRLEEIVDHFVILFWYVSRLKPGFAEAMMVKASPPEEVARELWPSIAAQLEFSPAQRARLEKQWFLCSKRLAQAEVTRQRWDDVLQRQQGAQEAQSPAAAAAAEGEHGEVVARAAAGVMGGEGMGMAAVARSSLAVQEAVSHLHMVAKAKDLAVKDFLGKLNWVLPTVVKARINVLSIPYFPDFLSITRHVLFPETGQPSSTASPEQPPQQLEVVGQG